MNQLSNFDKNSDFYINPSQSNLNQILMSNKYINILHSSEPSNIIYIPQTEKSIRTISADFKINCNSFERINDPVGFPLIISTFYKYKSLNPNEYNITYDSKILNALPCFLNSQILSLNLSEKEFTTQEEKILLFKNQDSYKLSNIKILDSEGNLVSPIYLKLNSLNKDSKSFYIFRNVINEITFNKNEYYISKLAKIILNF